MAYGTALAALADPTRRRVFERLKSGPKAGGALARGLPVSRPAGSQHLKGLEAAGLGGGRAAGPPPRLLHRPRWARRAAPVARPVLGRGTGGVCSRGRNQPREGQRRMNRTVTIAPVRKSIRVNANQAHAFEVFTS